MLRRQLNLKSIAHVIFSVFLTLLLCSTLYAQEGEEDIDYLDPEEKLERGLEITQHEKLEIVKNQFQEAIPCHLLKPKYYNGFPAWVVNARHPDGTSVAEGKVTSDVYKSLRFSSIQYQRVDESKRYYLPAYYFDFEKSEHAEFVGYLSFQVVQKREQYSPEKHDVWYPVESPSEVQGNWTVMPIKYNYRKKNTRHHPTGPNIPYIAYEICHSPFGVMPKETSTNGYHTAYPDFPYESHEFNGEEYMYSEDDVPTFFGYYHALSDRMEDHIQNYTNTINTMVMVRDLSFSAIPVVSTAMSVKNCLESENPYCWLSVAADAASDAAIVLKIGKVQSFLSKAGSSLSKAKDGEKIISSLNKVADRTLYVTAYGNATLGAFYLSRGEVIEGAVRLAAGGGDLFAAHIHQFRLYAGRVGKRPHCEPADLEITFEEVHLDDPRKALTDAGVNLEITEPLHTMSRAEYIANIREAQMLDHGSFQPPKVQIVRRVDTRPPLRVLKQGGMYRPALLDNGRVPGDDPIEHIMQNTGNYTSATYLDNSDHLLSNGYFFPTNGRVNYKSDVEIQQLFQRLSEGSGVPVEDLLASSDKYLLDWYKDFFRVRDLEWKPGSKVPEPIRYETYEYEAEVLAARASDRITGAEKEAITRGIRADEIIRARRVELSLEFKLIEKDGKVFLKSSTPKENSRTYGDWVNIREFYHTPD